MSNQSNQILIDASQSEIAEIRTNLIKKHRSLYSRKEFKAHSVVAEFYWTKIHSKPSYLTVQISEKEHIELVPTYLECINHSCDPNSFFDTTSKQLVSLKDIAVGEEITFFYPSAEWDMDQIFQCDCRCANCLGVIKGAKYLDERSLKNYRFTDFIKRKLASRGV